MGKKKEMREGKPGGSVVASCGSHEVDFSGGKWIAFGLVEVKRGWPCRVSSHEFGSHV